MSVEELDVSVGGAAPADPFAKALEEAERLKAQGNDSFRAQAYDAATGHYTVAIAVLEELRRPLEKVPDIVEEDADAGGDENEDLADENSTTEAAPAPAPEPADPRVVDLRQRLSVLYGNRAACHVHAEGFESAVDDCTSALELQPGYLKARMRRAAAAERLDELPDALRDYQEVLKVDPTNAVARRKAAELQPIVDQRMEELKEETMGKLKDLGNSMLGMFGLSIDNFQMQQGADGGYNISFNQGGAGEQPASG